MTSNWFVAWPVVADPAWLTALAADAPGGLKFSPPADLHVTLAFLGRFEEALLGKIAALVERLPLAGVDVVTERLVALPQPRRFSALAFSLARGRKDVEAQVAKCRDRICREAGARLETRPMLPHVTIARPVRKIGADDRDAALAWIETAPGQTPLRLERPRIFTHNEASSESVYRIL